MFRIAAVIAGYTGTYTVQSVLYNKKQQPCLQRLIFSQVSGLSRSSWKELLARVKKRLKNKKERKNYLNSRNKFLYNIL